MLVYKINLASIFNAFTNNSLIEWALEWEMIGHFY